MKSTIANIQKYRYINKIDLSIFLGITLILFSSFFLLYKPCIDGSCSLKFYFDSLYYLDYAQENSISNFSDFLILLLANRLGPFLTYKICQGNSFLILLFQSLILWYSIFRINDLKIIRSPFLWLNLILIISTVSISKEIYILYYVSILYTYIERKQVKYALILILISSLVRWQLLACSFLIIFYISFHKLINKKITTYLFIIGFLIAYSMVVKIFVANVEESINFWVNESIKKRGDGIGIYMLLTGYDKLGGYFLTFFFKFIFLAISGALKFLITFNFDPDYFHNFAEVSQSFGFIFLLFKWKRIRSMVSKEHLISLLILAIVFTAVQIFTPRYLFPVYLYLIILWQKSKKLYSSHLQQQALEHKILLKN